MVGEEGEEGRGAGYGERGVWEEEVAEVEEEQSTPQRVEKERTTDHRKSSGTRSTRASSLSTAHRAKITKAMRYGAIEVADALQVAANGLHPSVLEIIVAQHIEDVICHEVGAATVSDCCRCV